MAHNCQLPTAEDSVAGRVAKKVPPSQESSLASHFLSDITRMTNTGENSGVVTDVSTKTSEKAADMIARMTGLATSVLPPHSTDVTSAPQGYLTTTYTQGDDQITAIRFLPPNQLTSDPSGAGPSELCPIGNVGAKVQCGCGNYHICPNTPNNGNEGSDQTAVEGRSHQGSVKSHSTESGVSSKETPGATLKERLIEYILEVDIDQEEEEEIHF